MSSNGKYVLEIRRVIVVCDICRCPMEIIHAVLDYHSKWINLLFYDKYQSHFWTNISNFGRMVHTIIKPIVNVSQVYMTQNRKVTLDFGDDDFLRWRIIGIQWERISQTMDS